MYGDWSWELPTKSDTATTADSSLVLKRKFQYCVRFCRRGARRGVLICIVCCRFHWQLECHNVWVCIRVRFDLLSVVKCHCLKHHAFLQPRGMLGKSSNAGSTGTFGPLPKSDHTYILAAVGDISRCRFSNAGEMAYKLANILLAPFANQGDALRNAILLKARSAHTIGYIVRSVLRRRSTLHMITTLYLFSAREKTARTLRGSSLSTLILGTGAANQRPHAYCRSSNDSHYGWNIITFRASSPPV